jgi:putative transcriptional regulator
MPRTTRQDNQGSPPQGETDWDALDAMTDEEAQAAALADPDAPPLSEGRQMHPLAKVKRIRWRLKLTREAFAERYHIPVETVERWERYEVQPDAVAVAFLDAIASDPDGVANALARSVIPPTAAE